jgi:hypothetical protein
VQLADRGHVLKSLNTPKLGDSLLRVDGTPWMSQLAQSAPKLNWDDLAQIPALPLGSWLKTDPWDDRIHQLNAKLYAPMNPRDKMPLEVTPIYFKLQRYSATNVAPNNTAPAEQQPANGDPGNTPTPTATPGPGTAPPSAAQPAAGDSSAQQQPPPTPTPQFR